jgi:hypothetical protein
MFYLLCCIFKFLIAVIKKNNKRSINMASEVIATRGFFEFRNPIQSEELSAFTSRAVKVISSEFEYVTSCLRTITDNTQEMLKTIKKLRSLAILGDISPQEFNEQATRYNTVVASRVDYSDLKDRITHLSEGLSENIKYLTAVQGKLEKIVHFNLPGDIFNSAVTSRFEDVKDKLAQLVRYELVVKEIAKPLRGLLKEEYDTIKGLEARLNNGGQGLSKIQKGKTYLSSYVFSAAPPVEIALKAISSDHPVQADVEGGADVAAEPDQEAERATIASVANLAADLAAIASIAINAENAENEVVAPDQAGEAVIATVAAAQETDAESAASTPGAASAASTTEEDYQDAQTHSVTTPRPAGKKHTRYAVKAPVVNMAR